MHKAKQIFKRAKNSRRNACIQKRIFFYSSLLRITKMSGNRFVERFYIKPRKRRLKEVELSFSPYMQYNPVLPGRYLPSIKN